MLRRSLGVLAATVVSLATFAGPASAAERWADPAGAGGLCTALSPCSLSGAVTGAVDGDVVRVKPGTYAVGSMTVAQAIEIRGEGAGNPPVLSGTTAGATIVGDGGLRLTNLKITGTSGDALTLKGGARGDRLILHSDTGDGAEVVSDPGTTRLTNSLVTSGGGASTAALRMSDAGLVVGAVEVRNVTAYATGSGGNGARCETLVSTTTIVNSIFRGDGADIDS